MTTIDSNLIGLSTIEEIINYHKNLDINHASLFLKSKIEEHDIIFNTKFILDDYMDFIQNYIIDVTLSPKEYFKYKFKPKTLCFELYGNAELSFFILRINNMSSALEFTKRDLKLLKPTITNFISEVLILENDRIIKNNNEIK